MTCVKLRHIQLQNYDRAPAPTAPSLPHYYGTPEVRIACRLTKLWRIYWRHHYVTWPHVISINHILWCVVWLSNEANWYSDDVNILLPTDIIYIIHNTVHISAFYQLPNYILINMDSCWKTISLSATRHWTICSGTLSRSTADWCEGLERLRLRMQIRRWNILYSCTNSGSFAHLQGANADDANRILQTRLLHTLRSSWERVGLGHTA